MLLMRFSDGPFHEVDGSVAVVLRTFPTYLDQNIETGDWFYRSLWWCLVERIDPKGIDPVWYRIIAYCLLDFDARAIDA